MRRWRESAGTIKAIIGFVAWVGLWAVAMRMVGAASGDHPALFWCVFSLKLLAGLSFSGKSLTRSTSGGVVIGYGNWVDMVTFDGRVGPRNAFYEERAQDGGLQSLPFVRVVLDDGYPALCQVPLPRDEDWNAQTPP
jgi:hypothetical protein